MSELLVNTIKKADGTGSLSVPAESGTVVTTASPSLGRRNKIINGSAVVSQRGTSFASPADQYTLDRWYSRQDGAGVASIQQSTTAPTGFSHSILATVTTADSSLASTDRYWIAQFIEGFNFSDAAFGTASAKQITISFWVRSNLTGTFSGSITNSARNRSYPFTYSISSADTWEQKSVTISGDTTGTWIGGTNGIGLRVYFSLGSGSTYSGTADAWGGATYEAATGGTNVMATLSNTFYITGVQLEVGSVASSYEHRSYGEELALCQRYYQVIQEGAGSRDTGGGLSVPGEQLIGTGYCHASNRVMGSYRYPHPMRAVPSSAISSASHFSTLHPTNSWTSATTMNIRTTDKYARLDINGVSVTAGYACEIRIEASTGGKIEFDAEL